MSLTRRSFFGLLPGAAAALATGNAASGKGGVDMKLSPYDPDALRGTVVRAVPNVLFQDEDGRKYRFAGVEVTDKEELC